MKVCRVVEVDTFQPIRGAQIWMQPYAPIHPFWPSGDKGVTDANGEAKLSLPTDFWFYFYGAKAAGYSEVDNPEHRMAWPAGVFAVFYMKHDAHNESH
jgi:hypothetical protein